MKAYQTYIFDLDGTITDTLAVWFGIYHDCMQAFGMEPQDEQTISRHTHDWKQMIQLGLPADKLGDFTVMAHTLAKERLPEAQFHAGAFEALQFLKDHGKRIAIFSTMDRPLFEPAIKHHGLGNIAEACVAGTDVPARKPDPAGILKAMEDLGLSDTDKPTTVYIGDKDTDVQAAHNAGIDSILYYPAAHQLFYDEAELQAHKPTHIITDWAELLAPLQ